MNDKERQFDKMFGKLLKEHPETAGYGEYRTVDDVHEIPLPFPLDPDVLKNDEVDKAMKRATSVVALFRARHPDARKQTEIIETAEGITEITNWFAPGSAPATETFQLDLGAGLAATIEAVDSLKLMYPGAEFRTALTVSDYGVTLDVALAYPEE